MTEPAVKGATPSLDQSKEAIKKLAASGAGYEVLRAEVLKVVSPPFKSARKKIADDFQSGAINGLESARLVSQATDDLLTAPNLRRWR
jgi:hypothetical protein